MYADGCVFDVLLVFIFTLKAETSELNSFKSDSSRKFKDAFPWFRSRDNSFKTLKLAVSVSAPLCSLRSKTMFSPSTIVTLPENRPVAPSGGFQFPSATPVLLLECPPKPFKRSTVRT